MRDRQAALKRAARQRQFKSQEHVPVTYTEDLNQVNCFQSEAGAGAKYIKDHYDKMTPADKKLIQDSPYNICLACLDQERWDRNDSGDCMEKKSVEYGLRKMELKCYIAEMKKL